MKASVGRNCGRTLHRTLDLTGYEPQMLSRFLARSADTKCRGQSRFRCQTAEMSWEGGQQSRVRARTGLVIEVLSTNTES